jgi:hypothetical protein
MSQQPKSKPSIEYEIVGHGKDFRPIKKPIEGARFYEVKKARNVCLLAVAVEEKFKLLFDNFAEFEFELLRLAETSLIWPLSITLRDRDHFRGMQEKLTVDRRLVNFLTSCRLYLDQTEQVLSNLFGNPSQELDSTRAFKNKLHDECFSYRLMEALRNHVLHSVLAVHEISYRSSTIECAGRPDYVRFTVCPNSLVGDLAEDDAFKDSVLTELSQLADKIDLRGPVREYVSCLTKLHRKLREVTNNPFATNRSSYSTMVANYSTLDGEKVDNPSLSAVQSDGKVTETIALVTAFLGYYDELLMQNVVRTTIPHSEASNTDQKPQ